MTSGWFTGIWLRCGLAAIVSLGLLSACTSDGASDGASSHDSASAVEALPADPDSSTDDVSVVYVDSSLTVEAPDGTSWDSAYSLLADALASASADQEIWVAQGSYYPTYGDDRTASFTLLADVDLYGGFDGTETSRDERDWEANETILSGNIGDSDLATDNSYHVVIGSDDVIFDGFVIQDGYADGEDPDNEVLIETSDETADVEILRIVTGVKNSVGGGLFNLQAGTTTRNCVFRDNFAGKGGAVYNMVTQYWGGPEDSIIGDAPTFENCTFENNSAGRGGAMANDFTTATTIINSRFSNNTTDSKGGAIYADMGCPIYLVNVLFSDNEAERAAALTADGSSSHRGVFVTFVNNNADDLGAALYQGSYRGMTETGTFSGNEVHLYHSVVVGNTSQSSSTSISNWHDSSAEFDEASIVESVDGEMSIDDYLDPATYASLSEDYGWQEDRDVDLDHWLEVFEADTNKTYTAYSYDTTSPTGDVATIRVDVDATGNSNGETWDNAYTSLSDALNVATAGSEIWVAEGTYTPTNGTDRTETFVMKDGVAIYGGFDGSESDLADRDIESNETILSGDIGDTDHASDNSYHVLFGAKNAVLDGFIIEDGNADADFYHGRGGGLLLYDGATTSLANCTLRNNAAIEGGAIATYNESAIRMENCVVEDNTAVSGAGILFRIGPDSVETGSNITTTEFVNNIAADRGGALYIDYGAWVTLENCTISNNESQGNGGGVYVDDNSSQYETIEVRLNSCVISGNSTGKQGGGIAVYEGTVYLDNTTIEGNTAETGGGGVALDYNGGYEANSSTIAGNTSTEGADDVDDDAAAGGPRAGPPEGGSPDGETPEADSQPPDADGGPPGDGDNSLEDLGG